MSWQVVSKCHLLIQDHKTPFPIQRVVDGAIVYDMVCSLLFATLKGCRRSQIPLYIFEWNYLTPVHRRLNLTQAVLGILVPSGVGEISVIYVWSLVVLSFHSLFHVWSNQSTPLMLKSLLVYSRSCVSGTNGCLDLSCHWVLIEECVSL